MASFAVWMEEGMTAKKIADLLRRDLALEGRLDLDVVGAGTHAATSSRCALNIETGGAGPSLQNIFRRRSPFPCVTSQLSMKCPAAFKNIRNASCGGHENKRPHPRCHYGIWSCASLSTALVADT